MKKRAAVLSSGLLLVALSFLGTPETAATRPMGFATTIDTPTVAGSILNPAYFAHAAYVMQGASDHEKAFALPLNGVQELAFLPTLTGIDPASVIWDIEIIHPEGIGAEIAGNTLYIWGNNATWAGYGAVSLTASAARETGSVTIPVTVFRTDKTLTNSDGKKDYFVPWSPQLDVNRILSVDAYMQAYGMDDGSLDRTIRFSRWRPMVHVNGATVVGWANQAILGGFTERAIHDQVEAVFDELNQLGCNAVNLWRAYRQATPTSACPIEDFTEWFPCGPSMTDDELRWVINEAHRRGFYVILTPHVSEPSTRDFHPQSVSGWLACYRDIVLHNADLAQELGAEAFTIANILSPATFWIDPATSAARSWVAQMLQTAVDVRSVYSGATTYMLGGLQSEPNTDVLAPILEDVDIIGTNANMVGLTSSTAPSTAELAAGMYEFALKRFVPLSEKYGKPMYANEGGMLSYDGAVRDWDNTGAAPASAEYDGEEQADWYDAWFETEARFPFLFGFGWFCWGFQPGAGGDGDPWMSPRLKPAEGEIATAYGGNVDPIRLDGRSADWPKSPVRLQDSTSDSAGTGFDIISVRAAATDLYLYLLIEMDAGAPSSLVLQVLFDFEGDGIADAPLGVFYVPPNAGSPHGKWICTLSERPMLWSVLRGIPDVCANGDASAFEIRIPMRFLDDGPRLWARALALDTSRSQQTDITGWMQILAAT